MINAFWLGAILAALGFGSVPGLLAIIALFLMDGVLEVKQIHTQVQVIADVFRVEVEPLTEERIEELTASILSRVQHEQLGKRMD